MRNSGHMAPSPNGVYPSPAMLRLSAKGAFVLAALSAGLSACASSTSDRDDLDAGAGDGAALFPDGPPAAAADPNDAPPRRDFGEACADKAECVSNICIFAGVTGVCSALCAEGTCPAGWGCYGVVGAVSDGLVDDVCVPDSDQLCSPCTDGSE